MYAKSTHSLAPLTSAAAAAAAALIENITHSEKNPAQLSGSVTTTTAQANFSQPGTTHWAYAVSISMSSGMYVLFVRCIRNE